ncbi:MAG: hypothetical protein LBI60_02960 [Bacteroidales bacterium]|jgi:hypothetical protein|nr:hypothetical protein [Bacteroidales bacterium]
MEKEVKETKENMPEGVSKEMIEQAKLKYGQDKVKFLELPKDDEGTEFLTVLATVPTRTVIGQFTRFMESDPKKAQEILVKYCLLSHKDVVLADDGLFYGAVSTLADLIPIRKGIVKNC